MSLSLKQTNVTIAGTQLCTMMGLNVLENLELTLKVADELKDITHSLDLPFVFKASFDKANRSSINSFRGVGVEEGLEILAKVKTELNVPIITDIHTPEQAKPVAEVADILQLPAFLCRQTDLVVAAAKAAEEQSAWLHIKKAQFLAPWDVKNIISKCREAAPNVQIVLCERGTSFGYNNLIVDMLGIAQMQSLGVPVTIDTACNPHAGT